MSWDEMMRRVLNPMDGVTPHDTAHGYGEMRDGKPHRARDFNYWGGQSGLNMTHPTLRSPVNGVVEINGKDKWGTVGVRDADGNLHQILHTQNRYVSNGDPVSAGQMIGTMGNTGLGPLGHQHVHYQLHDSAGLNIDPGAWVDQQGHLDPNPAPPPLLRPFLQYLSGNFSGQDDEVNVSPDTPSVMAPDLPGCYLGSRTTSQRNPTSFDNRVGNWQSDGGGVTKPAPLVGIVNNRPMPDWPVPPPIFNTGASKDMPSRPAIPWLDDFRRYLDQTY